MDGGLKRRLEPAPEGESVPAGKVRQMAEGPFAQVEGAGAAYAYGGAGRVEAKAGKGAAHAIGDVFDDRFGAGGDPGGHGEAVAQAPFFVEAADADTCAAEVDSDGEAGGFAHGYAKGETRIDWSRLRFCMENIARLRRDTLEEGGCILSSQIYVVGFT